MIENLAWKFLPPYEFYFRVCFMERLVSLFYASFTEVSGLGWNYEKQTQTGSENTAQELPKAIKYGKITLKSPLVPLAAPFEIWVNDCCNSLNMKNAKDQIIALDMVITLQSQANVPVAAWLCSHCYPIGCSLSGLDAARSGLAMETVTLNCNRLDVNCRNYACCYKRNAYQDGCRKTNRHGGGSFGRAYPKD